MTDWVLEQGAEYRNGVAQPLIGRKVKVQPTPQFEIVRGYYTPDDCKALLARTPEPSVEAQMSGNMLLESLLDVKDFADVYDDLWSSFKAMGKTFGMKVTGIYEPPLLLDYTLGKKNDWHSDYGYEDRSKVSVSIALCPRSDYEGGYLEFMEEEAVSLDIGDAVFFCGYLTHRVTPVTAGRRQVLVAWAGGPNLR